MTQPTWKPRLIYSLKVALGFQLVWVLAAVIAALGGVFVNIGLILFLIPLLWVPAALELMTKSKLPLVLHLNYHLFITLSSVAGSAFGVYAVVPHWDTFVHVYSGTLLAWLGFFAVKVAGEQAKARIRGWFAVSVALATPLAFAALWEISEYLSDTYLGTTTQANLEDSIIDMFAALIGAVIAAILAVWLTWPKSVLPR